MGNLMSYRNLLRFVMLVLVAMGLLLVVSCSGDDDEGTSMINEEEALRIAHENASQVYRDLSIYKVTAVLKDGLWYVDYTIADPDTLGGGPHYVISEETGEIVSFRFAQ